MMCNRARSRTSVRRPVQTIALVPHALAVPPPTPRAPDGWTNISIGRNQATSLRLSKAVVTNPKRALQGPIRALNTRSRALRREIVSAEAAPCPSHGRPDYCFMCSTIGGYWEGAGNLNQTGGLPGLGGGSRCRLEGYRSPGTRYIFFTLQLTSTRTQRCQCSASGL
jgi:hypothetical protein